MSDYAAIGAIYETPEATGPKGNVIAHSEIIMIRVGSRLQRFGAQFDPAVLQWPGGSLIALLLLILTTVTAVLDSIFSKFESDRTCAFRKARVQIVISRRSYNV